ncbi:MAG: site-specific DNA-methyltransferase [Planctomycetota bacterium]|jgi:site-specific DNA-methyltransferase (adenine-specific)|nr:site-specific DNA-methyltransferase [Planctomycetota bacterium]
MFYNCDCIAGAGKYLADNSLDLIITDPPYGIGGDKLHKHYNRDESKVIDGYVEVAEKDYPEFSAKWLKEAERALRPGGAIYVVSGYTQLRHILNALAATKLQEVNHLIWKYNFGVYASRKYVSSHYHILYYAKRGGERTFNPNAFYADSEKNAGGGSLNYLDREDVWLINREYKPGKIKNKNELPAALLTKMLLYSSRENDLIGDFFLGSFATAKVALGLNRRACGFEINKNAFDYQMREMAKLRRGELLAGLRAPPPNRLVNKGKPLSATETAAIVENYQEMAASGWSKKSAVEKLSQTYGRGYWSISRMVAASPPPSAGVLFARLAE